MWRAYSRSFIKYNKVGNRFVGTLSFLAATLLSVISGMFYNFWMDQVQQSIMKTGASKVEVTPAIAAYIVVFTTISIALVLMIHYAFAATMAERIHQLGILQSVGATPGQIRTTLLNEILVLSLPAVVIGNLVGIIVCRGFMEFIISSTEEFRKYTLHFTYSPMVLVGSLLFSVITVAFSGWIPARKLSRIPPLEAIRCGNESGIRHIRKYRIFSCVFGVYGELACKSMYTRRKAMRVGNVSLFFAVFSFVTLLNMFGISNLSTERTYFDRFRDKWDFLITAENGQACEGLQEKLQKVDGVNGCIAHGMVNRTVSLPYEYLSAQVRTLGMENLNNAFVKDETGAYQVAVPIYILDDDSFYQYAGKTSHGQIIAVNMIWDSIHSKYTERRYIPFIDEGKNITLILDNEPITVSGFSYELPALREELEQYALTLVMGESTYASFWESASGALTYTIKVADEVAHQDVQAQLERIMADYPDCTLEGRIEETENEYRMQQGLRRFIYMLAGLIACIGIANIFASTLGQIHLRKHEFAKTLM